MTATIDWSDVRALIDEAERYGGIVGVTVMAPNGKSFTHHGDRQFRAASTVKIPIMIEVYRQIDRGQRSLADPYELRSEDHAVGSGVLLHLHDGIELTLNDLIYLMISISDNTATNILIDLAGMDRVNATMQDLQMIRSTLGRTMKGRPAQGDERENWATPNDYAGVLTAILNQTAASANACDQMIAMLQTQQCTRRISRYLPEADGVRWGSKTGSITGVTNDVGFIAKDDDALVLSIFCESLPDQHVGEQVIGDIARAAMQATSIVDALYSS